jgi:hypothetical protein
MKFIVHFVAAVMVLLPACLVLTIETLAGEMGGRAEYVGGTVKTLRERSEGRIQTTDAVFLLFRTRKGTMRVPYERINLLEYGQKVDRRVGLAIVISPMFLLSKERKHFLTIGYADEGGRQQALVFQVDKDDVRSVLVSLEARTGRKIQFQDEEARKAGKG